jgi:hypothetical protein
MLMLAFTVAGGMGAGAQDDASDGPPVEDLEGLQHGASRYYSMDYSAMMDDMSTPGAEMGVPTGVITLGGMIFEFDSDENAQAALDTLNEQAASEALLGEEETIEEVELGLGDNEFSYTGVEDIDGQEIEFVVALVQKGNYAYFVIAGGSGEDMQQVASDFTSHLIDNDGSGAGEFNDDGTSTGGLWDKFPAADDDLVSGLIPTDQVVFPVAESTPES